MHQSKKILQPLLLRVILLCTFSLLIFSYGNAQRPKSGGGGGGAKKSAPANKPAANKPAANKSVANNPTVNKPGNNNDAGKRTDISNSGNKDIKAGNKTNVGNKVNVDNSKKNVNVNVDNSKDIRVNNSRNTSVRRNTRPYGRPPYVYGGHRYRCYHPYYFHPYRPFAWGPMWHPWGFFITTLAVTAIILSVDNNMPGDLDQAMVPVFDNSYYPVETASAFPVSAAVFRPCNPEYNTNYSANTISENKDEYYYDQGVYYLKADGGYTVVSAPLGATIKTLPTGYETISIDDKTKNYYYGGTFYEKTASGYTVVAPMAGAVVEHISEGGEEVKMGDVTYVKLGETYYQPIQQDGKDMYEVADVEEDK